MSGPFDAFLRDCVSDCVDADDTPTLELDQCPCCAVPVEPGQPCMCCGVRLLERTYASCGVCGSIFHRAEECRR